MRPSVRSSRADYLEDGCKIGSSSPRNTLQADKATGSDLAPRFRQTTPSLQNFPMTRQMEEEV